MNTNGEVGRLPAHRNGTRPVCPSFQMVPVTSSLHNLLWAKYHSEGVKRVSIRNPHPVKHPETVDTRLIVARFKPRKKKGSTGSFICFVTSPDSLNLAPRRSLPKHWGCTECAGRSKKYTATWNKLTDGRRYNWLPIPDYRTWIRCYFWPCVSYTPLKSMPIYTWKHSLSKKRGDENVNLRDWHPLWLTPLYFAKL